ncbi:ATP-binding protein [Streptomyces sp. A5-4]|uniref:ATP-binding protein n=1 Tax=Streptomyces sp. A5-4 TaxID=3384771 RepID=UPI003DA8BFDC
MADPPFNIHIPEKVVALASPRRFQAAAAFPAARAVIPQVRRGLLTLLRQSGLAEVADLAVQAAHEVVANAVTHGCHGFAPDTEVTMTVTCDGQRLRLEVWDPSTTKPRVRPATHDEVGGRGMLLVAAFADRWGVQSPEEGGKIVWLELRVPASPEAQ